jgi:hypothetical protein
VRSDERACVVPDLVDIAVSPNGELVSELIKNRGQFSPTKPRRVLVEELGLEPSMALQELERAILLADPALQLAPTAAEQAGHRLVPPAMPCQLPPDIDDFTGRQAVVARLQQLLEAEQATAIVTSAIAGKAGVGKTAPAVRVAHRLRPRFPTGSCT